MKMIFLILLTLIFIFLSLILIFGSYRTIKTQTSANQRIFLQGQVSRELPNGLYRGEVTGLKTSWQGKKIDSKLGVGINIFKNQNEISEKYPFKIYKAPGLQDKMEVLKIDYNLSENPLWLRFIVDEIVATSKDKFLGKLHVKLLPGLIASLGYFTLEK